MFKRYFILFVLVMLMVKTNAQNTTFYYFRGNEVVLTESDDRLFLTLQENIAPEQRDALLLTIEQDVDFYIKGNPLTVTGNSLILTKNAGSSISNEEAENRYRNEPGVFSANFMFNTEANSLTSTTNHVFVRLKEETSYENLYNESSIFGIAEILQIENRRKLYKLTLQDGNTDPFVVANTLYETGNYEYAEPDFIWLMQGQSSSSTCSTINLQDPMFIDQWGLYNDGSSAHYVSPYQWADINICHAWEKTTGSSDINVAVMDDGVHMLHQDLDNGTTPSGWTITSTTTPIAGYAGAPAPQDIHGTLCAGIIRAQHNTYGIAGIAPDCKLTPVRFAFYDPSLSTMMGYDVWWSTTTDWENAFNWCTYTDESDVLSVSWFDGTYSSVVDDAMADAANDGRGGKGCVIVVSSGNHNKSNISWPAGQENSIAVGASSPCDERKRSAVNMAATSCTTASFVQSDPAGVSCDGDECWGSSYGTAASGAGTNILSVIAPGVGIPTTELGGAYADFDGTSAACPHVAGVAALMLSVNPCLRWDEVKSIIEETADKVNTSIYTYSSGYPSGTWNNEVGYGRLNAGNAMVWAHDIYRQDETVTSTLKTYSSYHKIFAGYDVDVTGIKGLGNYEVAGLSSDITFNAPEGIYLEPGFEVTSDATFWAQIITPPACTTSHSHYKPSGTNSNNNGTITKYSNRVDPIYDLKIYPNPTHEQLNISFSLANEANVTFSITNMLGQQLIEINTGKLTKGNYLRKIPTDHLSPGFYVINIKTDNKFNQYKFIKD